VAWLWSELRDGLLDRLTRDPAVKKDLARAQSTVALGEETAPAVARAILARWRG
jgi:hypothetical protein